MESCLCMFKCIHLYQGYQQGDDLCPSPVWLINVSWPTDVAQQVTGLEALFIILLLVHILGFIVKYLYYYMLFDH